jgi:flagellar biosynthesis protein FlhB
MADQTKTEQPTQRRLLKAREEGQFPAAREFVSALQFMVFLALLGAWGAAWFAQFRQAARSLFLLAFTPELKREDLTHIAWEIAWKHLFPLALGGMAVAIATLAFRLITTQFGFSFSKLAPDLSRLSPLAKLKNLPRENLPNLLQSVILLPIFLWAVYAIARDKMDAFLALPLESATVGWTFLGGSVMELFWKASGLFLIFGCVDLFRQMSRYKKDLRMSKHDIKEEARDSEGNPQMKGRIRRLQRDRLRRNMMKDVATATAVIVNPTHYAVAIRYHVDSMAAPLVVAKGKNYLALRIRQRALDNLIPIIENPPLARALYEAAEVGQEIPPHFFRAVAEILAYIYKLMNGRLPGQ